MSANSLKILKTDFFIGNRKWLRSNLKDGEVVIISANSRVQKSADQYFFSQQRDFFYLCGIDEPDWLLFLSTPEEFLVAPKISKIEKIFEGSLDSEKAANISGIDSVFSNQEGWKQITKNLNKAKEVLTILEPNSKIGRAYVNPAAKKLASKLKAKSSAPVLSIQPLIHDQRTIKQPIEIEALEKAVEITKLGLQGARKGLPNFISENEVEGAITNEFRVQRSQRHAYDPIVAGGLNACTLHYTKNDQVLNQSDLLLIDVGAEVDYYSADITRVWAIGEPTSRQKDIHQAVNRIRKQTIEIIRPGLSFKEYTKHFNYLMGEELVSLGLTSKPSLKTVHKFCPHGVSHFLGLDTHDPAPTGDTFQEGMVLTVEPGIYIPEENIGVRIEDNVLVTDRGSRNLSQAINTEL